MPLPTGPQPPESDERRSHRVKIPPGIEKVKIPVIIVQDWTEDIPVPIRYLSGDNDLDFETIYKNVKTLVLHPGRGRYEDDDNADNDLLWSVVECTKEFLEAFWTCTANLLDYFADFLAYDSAKIQSIWFHLLDELQKAALLPHTFWYDDVIPACTHAQQFGKDFEEALDLMNTVIGSRKLRPFDAVTRNPNLEGPMVEYTGRVGRFKTGLKPWQQFLCSGSPGFDVPKAERVYLGGKRQVMEAITSERYVPMGGLAIIQKHTDRLRDLTAKYARANADGRPEAEMVSHFDSLRLRVGETFTYQSIDGRDILVQQMHLTGQGPETPSREPGWADRRLEEKQPDSNLLDEAAGLYKGCTPFTHPRGNDKFHMWSITISRDRVSPENSLIDREEYSEMFDEWSVEEDLIKEVEEPYVISGFHQESNFTYRDPQNRYP